MAHTTRQHTHADGGWRPGEGAAGTGTLIRPGEGEEIIRVHARICDTSCQKPWAQAPIGSCSGLCKKDGDAYGSHSGQHVCNTCGYQW
jgi:hypothetical protein